MQRGSAIAVVAAAAGILVAGSAASVAVINAANSGTTNVDEPIVAASIAEPAQVDVILPDPEVSQAPLPQVIVPSPVDIPDASAQPVAEGATSGETSATEQTTDSKVTSNVTPKSTAATVEEKTAAPKATAEQTAEQTVEPTPELISARQARQVATAATPGSVLATSLVTHAGYDAYAVQIQRPDGSIVTGYVEATSGVAYDWVVDKAAPKPTATYDDDHDDDHDDDREDDDYDDDHDDDEREHEHDEDEDHDDD